jgi:hypothetical protein
MKVTEKQRADIAMSIGELSIKDAEAIAFKSGVSLSKVYSCLKAIRTTGTVIDPTDDVMLALIELAAMRKPTQEAKANRFKKSIEQISAKTRKQAA